jgi:hypothetical protein
LSPPRWVPPKETADGRGSLELKKQAEVRFKDAQALLDEFEKQIEVERFNRKPSYSYYHEYMLEQEKKKAAAPAHTPEQRPMPHAYTEDQPVEQPAIGLFAEQSVGCRTFNVAWRPPVSQWETGWG